MTPEAARERALDILSEVCGVERATLSPEVHLVKDLHLDSPTTLDLLITLEEELEVDIPAVEAAKLVRVQDVLDYVSQTAAG